MITYNNISDENNFDYLFRIYIGTSIWLSYIALNNYMKFTPDRFEVKYSIRD